MRSLRYVAFPYTSETGLMGRRPQTLALMLLLLVVANVAQAQSPEPSPADKETARNLYRRGHERFRSGDYHGALEAFQAADKIMDVPTTGLEVGRTQAQLLLLLEARDRLLQVSRYPQEPDEPEAYTKAREEAKVLAQEIAARIPAVRIEVRGPAGPMNERPDLVIKVDGQPLRRELYSLPRSLNPGRHVFDAIAPGFAPQRATESIAEGEQRVIQLVLVPRLAGDQPGPKPDGGNGSEPAGEEGISPLAWVGLGLGGAALVLGAATGIVTLSRAAALDEECPGKQCSAEQEEELESAKTLGHVSTASFVVGGVGVTAGLIVLLITIGDDDTASSPPAPGGVSAQPLIGPGFIGLRGRF